ncbi:MAG: alkaline phosphatase family protein [Candidatus Bipolaricaulota bacterium]|nr:alkaline phosphatase family protein [Candidatus Bipolaricaulota bacterium]
MITREGIEQKLLSNHLHSRLPEGLIAPDYGSYSIDSIPSFIRALFGERVERGDVLLPFLPSELPQRVLFLVLDGMGYMHLMRMLKQFPQMFLHRLIGKGEMLPLTSVFPATTATALSTLSTGVTPQEHGMLGYRLYLKETAAITNMISLSVLGSDTSDNALEAGIDEKTFLAPVTLFEHLRRLDVQSHMIMTKQIAKSGLSRLLYDGAAKMHPVVNLSDMLVAARETLNDAKGRTFVGLYWGDTDAIAHVHGPWTDAFTAELRAIDAALERELSGRVEDTLLLITADHGFVPMDAEDYIDITQYPELYGNLALPPVGDTRAAYLFVRDGKKNEVARFIAETFSGNVVCMDAEQALNAGLFGMGETLRESRDRIGDLVVASTGRKTLYYPYKDSVRLRGMHAGLTPEEMLVPFIISNLQGE